MGLIFYVPFALLLVPQTFPSYLETLWILPAFVVAFLVLRYVTVLTVKAGAAGANLFKNSDEKTVGLGQEEARIEQETYLQMLLGLIVVGEYITLALALVVPAASIVLIALIPGAGEWPETRQVGTALISTGLFGVAWLAFLETWGKVRLALPIIPIPLMFLMPIAVLGGVILFVMSFFGAEPQGKEGDKASVVSEMYQNYSEHDEKAVIP